MPKRTSIGVVVLFCGLSIFGSFAPSLAADPGGVNFTWQESSTAVTAPPELARFNELLADLAERLKPALVHVRVRRPAVAACVHLRTVRKGRSEN